MDQLRRGSYMCRVQGVSVTNAVVTIVMMTYINKGNKFLAPLTLNMVTAILQMIYAIMFQSLSVFPKVRDDAGLPHVKNMATLYLTLLVSTSTVLPLIAFVWNLCLTPSPANMSVVYLWNIVMFINSFIVFIAL